MPYPLRVIALGGDARMARDVDGRLDAFLDAQGWSAMIVRPDFYVYGGAADGPTLERLARALADDLGGTSRWRVPALTAMETA